MDGARISLEDAWVVKLRWVNENADHDNLIFPAASYHGRGLRARTRAQSRKRPALQEQSPDGQYFAPSPCFAPGLESLRRHARIEAAARYGPSQVYRFGPFVELHLHVRPRPRA